MKRHLATAATAIVLAATSALAEPQVGQPAPDFTLTDSTGKQHSLSDFKGKVVVLEWLNHGCPFVVKHYGSNNMQNLQKEAAADGAVWLSIVSSAPGKEGHMSPQDAEKKRQEVGSEAAAVLIDEDGKVGKLYGAKRTPEMYIINEEGILVYHGAIDDKPSTDQGDVASAKNYVKIGLAEMKSGKALSNPKTPAYGCPVKYAD